MPAKQTPPNSGMAAFVSAFMYCAALMAAVVLVVIGHSTPVEASGVVSPFLVVFEGVKARH
ncbi:hypothetical protein ACFXAW_07075 [Streptomyces sp. NPDC059445]|uniref:hypothetical protein n=1 Tax=Streptomyces sp. NPDC059445 TaxID=3346832 RepID=UPI00369FA2C3